MASNEDNVFDYLKQELRVKMNEYADHISGGACKDYSDYAKLCGVIEGLAIAEREILDLKARFESE
jgi:hypothetical protein|tara:strand:+ start:417 stop:614 length:198 start_codon:yes stop_codon:yes gene_type:complete